MNIMTKRGNQDNVVTYEHVCDTKADLDNINPEYITLGSVAIVLKDDAGLGIYMATSDKKWVLLTSGGGAAVGGISLPEVTIADNGKVLGVINGEWNKMTDNKAGGIFIVHATHKGMTTTLDKTWQEIHDAFFDGGRIVALVSEEIPNAYEIFYATAIGVVPDGAYVVQIGNTKFETSSSSGYPAYTEEYMPMS